MEDFFKKYWYIFTIILIFISAIVIRFYKLGQIPHGMTWDEAAIGYNGYAVFNTRRDEWLDFLPISFQSFGDYKAPLAIYLNGFFTAIFGMNLFAVRLPFTIISIFTIASLMWLTHELFISLPRKKRQLITVSSGLLIALSPWHIHYSRTGFESGIALFFLLLGLASLTKFMNTKYTKTKFTYIGLLSFSASIYTYHSSKIVIPVLLLSIFLVNIKYFIRSYKQYLLPVLLFIFSLLPFLYDSIFGAGLTRAGVTFLSDPTISFIEKVRTFLANYFSHFSIDFLLNGATTTLRHGVGEIGVLYPTTFVLVLLSVLAFKNKNFRKHFKIGLFLVLIGTLPAAIASEVPHSNRAFLALPGYILLAISGLLVLENLLKQSQTFKYIVGSHGEKQIILKSAIGILLALHVIFSVNFLSHYFNNFAQSSAASFRDGYIEAFSIAQEYELGLNGKPEVDKILFSSEYGQPYIYALFVKQTNPIWYQGGSLIKYEFSDTVSVGELLRENTLVVGTQESELPIRKADHIIYGSDGSARFVLIYTGKGAE